MNSKKYVKEISEKSDREWAYVSHIERDHSDWYLVLEDGRRLGGMASFSTPNPEGGAYKVDASFILTGSWTNAIINDIAAQLAAANARADKARDAALVEAANLFRDNFHESVKRPYAAHMIESLRNKP